MADDQDGRKSVLQKHRFFDLTGESKRDCNKMNGKAQKTDTRTNGSNEKYHGQDRDTCCIHPQFPKAADHEDEGMSFLQEII